MYGTQTYVFGFSWEQLFENDVKMYGTQTTNGWFKDSPEFENDVKMYGTQTILSRAVVGDGLRMM